MNAITHLSSTATSNTALAAALSALGIPLAEKPFVRVVGDGNLIACTRNPTSKITNTHKVFI